MFDAVQRESRVGKVAANKGSNRKLDAVQWKMRTESNWKAWMRKQRAGTNIKLEQYNAGWCK